MAGKPVVIPGLLNKLIVQSVRFSPRSTVRRSRARCRKKPEDSGAGSLGLGTAGRCGGQGELAARFA